VVKLSRSSSLDPSDFPLVAWISREGTEFAVLFETMEAHGSWVSHALCTGFHRATVLANIVVRTSVGFISFHTSKWS
jgi:tetrahydromethanopterin S-methyltransferase subunit B